MKPSTLNILRFAAGIILTTSASVFAQTATTDPVGFITLNVAGTGGVGTDKLSFKGLGLTRSVEYQGSAETVGTNTVVDNEATWTDGQFNGANGAYYLEVVSIGGSTTAAGVGSIYDIATTTAATKTITLSQNLAAGVTAPAVFKVRKHWTIGSVFGPANEGGLQAGNSSTADKVLVYNGATYDTYFYSSGGLIGTGWRKVGSSPANQDQSGAKIYPDEGLILDRQQSAAVNVVLMGAVKTGQTLTPILNGLNFVGNVYAADMTLGSSGLQTSGLTSGNSTTADTVQIYNGSTYDTYYISSGGLVGAGWRKVGSSPANQDQATTPIPVGASVIVTRKAAGNFDWVAPQHPASL